MEVFASGMLARLGAASGVSGLDEQALVMMIADEVLAGGDGLGTGGSRKGAGEGGGAS